MRGKDKNIFPILSQKRSQFSQCCNDFVVNIRDQAGAFNKHITKSVYHDCKKIYRCFESSTSKSNMGET